MGARSLVTAERSTRPPKRKPLFDPSVRKGTPTKTERSMIAQFVQDQPTEVTDKQVTALAKVMRRSKHVIKQLVEEARENFAASAVDYVAAHKQAIVQGLANGDAKSLDVVVKGSQWAMENLAAEGVRVVERSSGGSSSGPRIFIGVKVGGQNAQAPQVEVVESPSE